MSRFVVLFVSVCVLVAGPGASAGFLFEPGIGYNKGQEQASSVQGTGLLLRLGWEFSSFFIAADADYSDLQQGAINSVKYTNTGLSIGGKIDKFRIWYGVISSATYAYPSGVATVTTTGSGSKIGVGAQVGGKLHLNLELKSLNFTSTNNGTTTSAVTELGTLGFLSFSWTL